MFLDEPVTGISYCPTKGCNGTLYIHDLESGMMSCTECGFEKEVK